MLNFSDAFSFLFKEKKWGLKFGIIFFFSFAVTTISSIMDLFSYDGHAAGGRLATKDFSLLQSSFLLTFACTYLVLALVYVVISVWYNYEVIQSGIQLRSTKLIWDNSFADVIKKVSKYVLTSLIYWIISSIFIAIVVGVPLILGFIVLAFLSYGGTAEGLRTAGNAFPAMALLLLCLGLLALLLIGGAVYILTMPGYLRLIASNTLSEAFNFKSNFRIARKYFGYFLVILIFICIAAFAIGFISGIASFITTALLLTSPALAIILEIIFQIPLMMLLTYLTYFVYGRLLGNLYRGIINKEPELKFLRVVKEKA